ncbi:MAG: hypothetical protein R8L07_19430 [Alphaproteobacteria bacterium]|nr:hypothetical protein [Alphaproteobacteria bacterium]
MAPVPGTGSVPKVTRWDPAGWLSLVVSPICAGMAWLSAEAPVDGLCNSLTGMPLISDMALMYFLMGLFHLPPWLRLTAATFNSHSEGN